MHGETLKFETSVTIYKTTGCNSPEKLNPRTAFAITNIIC